MDHPKPLYAAGLPIVLADSVSADRPGVPANGEHLEARNGPSPEPTPDRGSSADAGVS